MKKKHRQLFTTVMAYLFFLGSVLVPRPVQASASGNYTDLLPIGAAENTTVISRGTGWALTTLPATQTFGDALSRVVTTVYQSTATTSINATTTVSTFSALSQGNVGSTTFPADWVATGRSIEVHIRGVYSTPANETGAWTIKLGTTTILNTGALTVHGSQANSSFAASAYLTIGATGTSGTMFGNYDIYLASGSTSSGATLLSYSTSTISAVTVDLATQLTVNPTFAWGTGNSSMTVTNVIVKFLN